MRAFVRVTDSDWYTHLASRPGLDEVNFWKPDGATNFVALAPGELFLFKLHAPEHAIVGGGVFAHFSKLPISLAWEAFGEKNGVRDLPELRARVERYRRTSAPGEDYTVGCILLEEPFFFAPDEWVPAPRDWHPNIVQGRGYDLRAGAGRELREAVAVRLAARPTAPQPGIAAAAGARFGPPRPVAPRLGQGTFRVAVTDAYGRRCAVTGERTLPVLQAAHIRPYAEHGPHEVRNGLLLRSDVHALFDRGYVTVTPEYRVEVSRRIREEFSNGRAYYALHGQRIAIPDHPPSRPDPALLGWHASAVFRG